MMNNVTVNITSSLFSTMSHKGLLLFYIFADNPYDDVVSSIVIKGTNFTHLSYDPGLITESSLQIRLSPNIIVTFSRVTIASNHFSDTYTGHREATILSINRDLSTINKQVSRVIIESCNFLNDTANNLLHVEGNVYLDVINNNFLNNNVNSALSITSSHNEYDTINKIARFVQNSFISNNGGTLISLNGTYVVVIVTELQIINNTLSSEYNSLLLFHNYTVLLASFNEVKYEYNNIAKSSSGFYFAPRPSGTIISIAHYDYVFGSLICIPPHYNFIEYGY